MANRKRSGRIIFTVSVWKSPEWPFEKGKKFRKGGQAGVDEDGWFLVLKNKEEDRPPFDAIVCWVFRVNVIFLWCCTFGNFLSVLL